jgi:hypothetical protein
MKIPFVGPAFKTRSSIFNSEDLYNMYLERGSQTSRSPVAFIGTPGIYTWAALPASGPVRGTGVFNPTYSIAVAFDRVYRIDTAGIFTQIGTIDAAVTPVSMASNGNVMMLVTGPNGYVIDVVAGTVSQITDPDFLGGDTVYYIDGYFVVNVPGTQKWMISQLLGTDFDALDFASAEGSPDLLLSLLVDHREIWLFGENTTEVFFNSGANPDFPFERIPGAFLEHGCAAKFSPAKLDNTVYWLSKDTNGQGMIMKASGYQPVRVSTYAVEFDIAKMIKEFGHIDDAIAFTYQQEGHSFYVLSFPTANKTWVYDVGENLWHRRCYRNPVNNNKEMIRPWNQIQFANKTIVGDHENSNLYVLDLDTYTDNGDRIPRIRITPHIVDADNKMQFFFSLEVCMEVGVGEVTGPGEDPRGVLRWSDDGGKTWSPEMVRSFGKVGEYETRCRFPKLGKARDRVYEFTITDPVKVAIVSAISNHKVGIS